MVKQHVPTLFDHSLFLGDFVILAIGRDLFRYSLVAKKITDRKAMDSSVIKLCKKIDRESFCICEKSVQILDSSLSIKKESKRHVADIIVKAVKC